MKRRTRLTLPNCITFGRIAGAFLLWFTQPLSPIFYGIYTLCGFSDLLDGLIARATNSTSEFGAMLDSIADLLFYAVMMLKILPVMWELLPHWIWWAVAMVLAVRVVSYTVAAVRHHRFAALHTYLNKCTGAMLFAVPYFLSLPFAVGYCALVCAVGITASAEELWIHWIAEDYQADRKSVLWILKNKGGKHLFRRFLWNKRL